MGLCRTTAGLFAAMLKKLLSSVDPVLNQAGDFLILRKGTGSRQFILRAEGD
jgi:hypothetical protein